jgi:hypothetical protein
MGFGFAKSTTSVTAFQALVWCELSFLGRDDGLPATALRQAGQPGMLWKATGMPPASILERSAPISYLAIRSQHALVNFMMISVTSATMQGLGCFV